MSSSRKMWGWTGRIADVFGVVGAVATALAAVGTMIAAWLDSARAVPMFWWPLVFVFGVLLISFVLAASCLLVAMARQRWSGGSAGSSGAKTAPTELEKPAPTPPGSSKFWTTSDYAAEMEKERALRSADTPPTLDASRLIAREGLLSSIAKTIKELSHEMRSARAVLDEVFSAKVADEDKAKAADAVERWSRNLSKLQHELGRAGYPVRVVLTDVGWLRSPHPLQGYGRYDDFAEARSVRLYWDQIMAHDTQVPEAETKLRQELKDLQAQLERLASR